MSSFAAASSVRAVAFAAAAGLAACGGGGGDGTAPPAFELPPLPVAPSGDPVVRVSAQTPFAANCNGAPQTGTLYANAEVEPLAAINPVNPSNLIVVYQQDRWSDGGSQGIMAASSLDGGHTWTRRALAHTHCAGGNAGNGGDYQRASNPWLAIGPDGTAYALTLAFSGGVLAAGSTSAMLAARSTDGGVTWSGPATLISDGGAFFNDKGSIAVDRLDARYVYAAWDRLSNTNSGPAMIARSADGGLTWTAAAILYDPGQDNQTINNIVAVLDDGSVVDCFIEIDHLSTTMDASIKIMRSTDHGATWSAPVKIADDLAVGVHDPQTGRPVRDASILPALAVGPGGALYVAWQDARFSAGARDGIALSRSGDGGLTWSAPLQVNAVSTAQAFDPGVTVRSDGTVAVAYYDLRNDTADAGSLLTDYWLTRSTDGVNWSEAHIAASFNLDLAPVTTSGLFLGDYQGLLGGGDFLLIYTQTNSGGVNDPTDIYGVLAQSLRASQTAVVAQRGEMAPLVGAEFRAAVRENMRRVIGAGRPDQR